MKNVIKKAISILLVAVMLFGAAPLAGFVGLELPRLNLFAVNANAEESATSGTCGENLTWSFDNATGELVISGTGNMTNWYHLYDRYAPWYNKRYSIKTVSISSGVTSIGDYAFSGCSCLVDIDIPDTVTTIGSNTFFECSNLTSINIPNKVTRIGSSAFRNCSSINELYIPNSVSLIGVEAFRGMNSLEKLTIPFIGNSKSDKTLDYFGYVFGNANFGTTGTVRQYIGDSPTDCSAIDCYISTSLRSVTVTSSKTIPFGALSGCYFLTQIILHNSLTSIEAFAFRNCSALKKIVISENVSSIGEEAFYNCTSLTDVYYVGTAEQWKGVKIGKNNEPLGKANVHFNHIHAISTVEESVVPTCDEGGYKKGICICGYTLTEDVPALNHKDTLVQVEAKAPTCTEIGWDAYEYCTACNYTTYAEKKALDHDIVIVKSVAPTCTETGLTAGQHCSRCDDITVEQETIPALNHKDTLVQVGAQAPTCTEIGWDAYEYCTACDYTTYAEKDALEHNIVIDEAVASTCTETGLTAGQHCSRCDDATIEQKVVPVKPHNYTAKYDSAKHWEECACGSKINIQNHSFVGGNSCSCGFKRVVDSAIKIRNNNGSKTINYGETLKLTATVTAKPANAKIYWYVDGEKEGEGEVFNVKFESGTKIITVKLVDENGVVYQNASDDEITDSENVTVKGGFFQKLISFFKNLFGMNRTIVQAFKVIY